MHKSPFNLHRTKDFISPLLSPIEQALDTHGPLTAMADGGSKDALVVGLQPLHVHELQAVLKAATDNRFGFVVVPFVHPRLKRADPLADARDQPFARSDLVLTGRQWSYLIVGQMSGWINLDSANKVNGVGRHQMLRHLPDARIEHAVNDFPLRHDTVVIP